MNLQLKLHHYTLQGLLERINFSISFSKTQFYNITYSAGLITEQCLRYLYNTGYLCWQNNTGPSES